MKRIVEIMQNDMNVLNSQISPQQLVIKVRKGSQREFPQPRDYAYTTIIDDNIIVVFAPKMLRATPDRIQAIMRHEMSHALHMFQNNHDHSEQQTDDLAEQIWGDRIYYDDEDLQTLEYGKYPRPSYLHQ
jgi:hypothetical protein